MVLRGEEKIVVRLAARTRSGRTLTPQNRSDKVLRKDETKSSIRFSSHPRSAARRVHVQPNSYPRWGIPCQESSLACKGIGLEGPAGTAHAPAESRRPRDCL